MYTEKQLLDLSETLQRSAKFLSNRINHVTEASDALRAFNFLDRLQLGSVKISGFIAGPDAAGGFRETDEESSELMLDALPKQLRDQLREWLQLVCEWHAVKGYLQEPAPVLFPDLEKNRGRCVLDPPPAKSL